MKNKIVILMLCALVMFVAKGAEAQDINTGGTYPIMVNIGAGSGNDMQSNANINTSTSNNEIKANGGAGGLANSNSSSNASGNGTGNVTQFDQIRQSPSVFMNAPAPTAPCQATAGGFVSFIAGGGFAASYTLEECEIRESSRIAHGIGQTNMAREIICMGKFAKLTPSCLK